ncbi:hypothetical protein TTRE_0000580901 [Trichuris trichiura]|uniref:Transmembrane protein 94 n=1 Tax=Trichuris trichiura TaxID=36087 RepID=A0A077ZAY2_TRITR|nr:hypothetical protein TTRE_0000580901 [Trichuris trichiura]
MEGLTTTRALFLLRNSLSAEVSVFSRHQSMFSWENFKAFKHSCNGCQVYCIAYGSLTLLSVMILIVNGSLHAIYDLCAGIWLFILLLLNTLLALYVFYMCSSELIRKSQGLVNLIDRMASEKILSLVTPPLHCPVSESIELCWTYRDGIVVNLPSVLLVPGDIILLRPGHPVVCRCHSAMPDRSFERGDVYLPENVRFSSLSSVSPLEPLTVEVTESVLQKCHVFGAHTISPLEKEYELILHSCFEKVLLPTVAFVCFLSSVSRYFAYQRLDLYWLGNFTVDLGIAMLPLLFPSLPIFFIGFNREDGAAFIEDKKPTKRNVFSTKGILSWPDPSVEKAFFFSSDAEHPSKQKTRCDALSALSSITKGAYVMDLSQETTRPFKVHFDDPNWHILLSHLRPLGLNALLNSCLLQSEYCHFLDHLRVIAASVPGTTPVVNRRCLCPLMDAMQLSRDAITQFEQPPTVLCAYRRRTADLPPIPGSPRYKIPLSNLFATINKDKASCYVQMMCQGSADMVLDVCRYYWDGEAARPLNQNHVKRVQDFSNRHNMTAYCLALSYRPLPLWAADLKHDDYYDLTNHCCNAKEESDTAQARAVSCSMDSLFFDELLTNADKSDGTLLPKPDIVHLVEQLDKSCIRFVHFSKENEYALRSRVFAEKMGLEAGWNCHISLEKEHSPDGVLLRLLLPDNHVHRSSFSGRSSVSAELSVAPSFANAEKFLLTNRARLPKGIENVRPHLDNVDNVPLLVSLFTDCTARTSCEMIEIMQEYGEVVCVVGSSLTPENTAIFCRANVAISVEPMIPSGCCEMQKIKGRSGKSALEIAHFINSLPCSLSVKLDEAFLLNNTIDLSRHMLLTFRISFYFFLSVSTLITVVHLLALLFAMPRPLTANMVLWLLSGVLPPLCATLALSPLHPGGTELVTFKNKSRLGKKEVQIACGTFATKFAPTGFALFLLYRALVHYLCKFEQQQTDRDPRWPLVNGTCQLYLLWNSNSDYLNVVQRLCFSFFVLYTVALSASHVFYYEHIWKRVPFRSTSWTAVSGIVLLIQLSFCILPICWSSQLLRLMTGIPWYVYIAVAKRFEITRFNRDQRRRRLSFDTKLGMNSPF